MKTWRAVALAAAVGLGALSARAQTVTNVVWQTNIVNIETNGGGAPWLSGPLIDAFKFFGQGSNWVVAPYGIVVQGDRKYDFGGGIALGYKLNEYLMPTMRLDYVNKELWMPSLSLQLQAPLTLFGKVTVVPFGFSGIATPLSGQGNEDGSVVGIFGAGGAVRLDFIGSAAFWRHTDLVGDYEIWTGGGFGNQKQFRFGLAYKF